MKLTAWIIPALAPLTAVSVLAQASNATLPPVVAPPPTAAASAAAPATEPALTSKPAAKPKAKHTKPKAKTKAREKSAAKPSEKSKEEKAPATKNGVIVLNPPVSAAVKCNVLDVRGQGSFAGEIITYLKKGESVTVLEEITLAHAKAGEPKDWSKIVMPANTAVWINAEYINADSMTVKTAKLNVRGGPGENYSVIGRLTKGDAVKEIGRKEGWLEIASPANAFAFVASQYLEHGAPAAELAATPPSQPPPSEPAPVPAPPRTAPPPAAPPVVVNVPTESAPPAPAQTPSPSSTGLIAPAPTATSQSDQELAALHRSTAPQPAVTVPVPTIGDGKEDVPRVVTREGTINHTYSIQAPTAYELRDLRTGTATEYLQPATNSAAQKVFKALVGKKVRVTGSEFFDPNWPRTPILHIETTDRM